VKIARFTGCKNFVGKREKFIFNENNFVGKRDNFIVKPFNHLSQWRDLRMGVICMNL